VIDLNERQHESLARVRAAGSAGLALGDGIAAGDALLMDLHGLVKLDRARQRVTISARGASFLARAAA
jgi:hypothetical protein